MLTIQESYQKLIKSKDFKKKGSLCSLFFTSDIEDIEKSSWQIDFYNKESDTITSYVINDKIEVNQDLEIFKEKATKIEDLKIEDIKIDFNEALEKAEESLKKNNEEATKIIVILQKQNKTSWNISFITKKFNMINIKIDAVNGKILEEKTIPLLAFKK